MGIPACSKKKDFGRQAWNDRREWKRNPSNAGSFWHQVRKKPELWADKSKLYLDMKDPLQDLETLFDEAILKSEFDFVLTLINYRGVYENR